MSVERISDNLRFALGRSIEVAASGSEAVNDFYGKPYRRGALMNRTVKVFRMNDWDWWAGETLGSTIARYVEEIDWREGTLKDPRELTEAEMERLHFVDGDDPINADGTPGGTLSFRKALDRMIERGENFPCFFASTEY